MRDIDLREGGAVVMKGFDVWKVSCVGDCVGDIPPDDVGENEVPIEGVSKPRCSEFTLEDLLCLESEDDSIIYSGIAITLEESKSGKI